MADPVTVFADRLLDLASQHNLATGVGGLALALAVVLRAAALRDAHDHVPAPFTVIELAEDLIQLSSAMALAVASEQSPKSPS